MLFEGFSGFQAAQGAAFGLAASTAGIALGRWLRRGARAGVSRHFDAIVRAAQRQGMEPHPGEAPRAFLRRLARRCPAAESAIERFARLYLRSRFGGHRLDDGARRVAARTRKEIIRSLRRDGLT
jgi:hypothetical protein